MSKSHKSLLNNLREIKLSYVYPNYRLIKELIYFIIMLNNCFRFGALTLSKSYCSRLFPLRVRTASVSRNLRTASIRASASTRTTSMSPSGSWTSSSQTMSTPTVRKPYCVCKHVFVWAIYV